MSKKPSILINLDRPRKLRFTTNAIADLEEITNRPIHELAERMGVREIRAAIWAGLQHETDNLTLKQAGDLLDEAESMEYVAEKLTEALMASFGGEGEEKNVKAVADGIMEKPSV